MIYGFRSGDTGTRQGCHIPGASIALTGGKISCRAYGSPRLERPKRLDWTTINRRSMDTIVAEVSGWYSALAPILLSGE